MGGWEGLEMTIDKVHFYDQIADEFDDVMNHYDLQRRLGIVFNDL